MGFQRDGRPVEQRIVMTGVDLARNDFSGRRAKYFTAVSCRFAECDFSGVQITHGGSFGGGDGYTEYVDCLFDGAKFAGISAGRATFVRCSFRDVWIRKMFSHDAEFIDCVFSGRIQSAVFNGRTAQYEGMVPNPKEGLEFKDNDFSAATLEDVGFRSGVDLSRQSMPSGPDYILLLKAGPTLRRAWDISEALPTTDPHRDSVRAILRAGLDELADGQEDFFRSLVGRQDVAGGQALRAVLAQAQLAVREAEDPGS